MGRLDFSKFVDAESTVTHIAHQDAKSCLAGTKASEFIQLMLDGSDRLAVTDEKNNFQGMIKSLDVLDFLGGGQRYAKFLAGRLNTKAETIMQGAEAVTPRHTVSKALSSMVKRNIDSCPLLVGKKFSGMVTEMGFIRHMKGKIGVRVEEAMVAKPMFVKDYFSVAEVASIMVRAHYRRLPVVSKGVLMGMVTPHDIISHLKTKSMLHGLKEQTLPISEVMNKNVVTASPKEDLGTVINKMKAGYTALPVAEENELMGIITARDVLELFL